MIAIEAEGPDADPRQPIHKTVCLDDAEADDFERQVRDAGGRILARWEMSESEAHHYNASMSCPEGY